MGVGIFVKNVIHVELSMKNEQEYKSYLFRYYHNGSWWNLEIPATSLEDAQERINKLPNAQPLGEMMARIPAGLGLFAKLWCWWKNTKSSNAV